jgi:hypothetical protein
MARIEVPVPFLKREVGSGDALKAGLSAVGIEQKQGCGCKKTQQAMNRGVAFVPVKKEK